MKRIGKWLLRLVSTALILALMVAALPYTAKLLALLLPQPDPVYTTTLLKREMAKVGKLTCMEYKDTGIAAASTSALFLGDVQSVSIPYEYTIALGVDLEKVAVTLQEDKITVTLPPVMMLYDSFDVTGEAQIQDFWLPLSQKRYQDILDDHALRCRSEILSDSELMQKAQKATIEKVTNLYKQVLQEEQLQYTPVSIVIPS